MKDVVVYGRDEPVCVGCVAVKTKLNNKGIQYQYKDVTNDDFYQEMCELRLRSIPAVFVDGIYMQGEANIDKVIEEVLS